MRWQPLGADGHVTGPANLAPVTVMVCALLLLLSSARCSVPWHVTIDDKPSGGSDHTLNAAFSQIGSVTVATAGSSRDAEAGGLSGGSSDGTIRNGHRSSSSSSSSGSSKISNKDGSEYSGKARSEGCSNAISGNDCEAISSGSSRGGDEIASLDQFSSSQSSQHAAPDQTTDVSDRQSQEKIPSKRIQQDANQPALAISQLEQTHRRRPEIVAVSQDTCAAPAASQLVDLLKGGSASAVCDARGDGKRWRSRTDGNAIGAAALSSEGDNLSL